MNKIWKFGLTFLFCAALLTGCGSKQQTTVGEVTQIQTAENGALTSFVIQTSEGKSVGILLREDTLAYPLQNSSWTTGEMRAAFQETLAPGTRISAHLASGRRSLTTDNGKKITAYEADYISITGVLNREAVTLADGTKLDVMEGYPSSRTYQLADGTQLLQVRTPSGPENTYVGRIGNYNDLPPAVQEKVSAWYQNRGLLYEEEKELEKAYAQWQELGDGFRCGLVEQDVSPTASSHRVMYFLTSVTLPAEQDGTSVVDVLRLSDAFDQETGEHLSTWQLFTRPKDEVKQIILDQSGIIEQPLRSEMEAADWESRVILFPNSLSVEFSPGDLPSQEYSFSLYLDYENIPGLFQEWAAPNP